MGKEFLTIVGSRGRKNPANLTGFIHTCLMIGRKRICCPDHMMQQHLDYLSTNHECSHYCSYLLLSSTLLKDLATNHIPSGSALSLSFKERPDTRGHGRVEEFFAVLALMLTVNCIVSKAKQKLANLRLYKRSDVLKISAPQVLSYKLCLLLLTVKVTLSKSEVTSSNTAN